MMMNNVKYANPKTGLNKIVKVSQKLSSVLATGYETRYTKGTSLKQANRKMLKAGLYRAGIRAI